VSDELPICGLLEAGVVRVASRVICVEPLGMGGKYRCRRRFRALTNSELEAYIAKVRVASSSLVSRLDTQVPRLG
jgi:hypothetical protein